jgi:hypothetical protein
MPSSREAHLSRRFWCAIGVEIKRCEVITSLADCSASQRKDLDIHIQLLKVLILDSEAPELELMEISLRYLKAIQAELKDMTFLGQRAAEVLREPEIPRGEPDGSA